ncbi:MAG: ASPIC/UnbV domain-containing protein [Acidobacteriota bacterium]
MASTVSDEKAGNDTYEKNHMALIFKQGLSFSGFERNKLFLNLKGKRFKDISGVSGTDSILDGRSTVLADFDNDGDLDVFLTSIQGQAHQLFRNNVGQDNHYVRLSLVGTRSGTDAFGAQVRLKTTQGIQTRVQSGGNGFLAHHDPRLLFGLGRSREAEWVEILWPSGTRERFGPVEADTSLRIVEGEGGRPHTIVERRLNLPDPVSVKETFWSRLRFDKGGRLPDLPLKALRGDGAGESVNLETGAPYFLNFWATFCGPCRQEMPELEKLRHRFEAKGIRLVGISLDESPKGVRSFAEKLGVSYPLYLADGPAVADLFAHRQIFIPLSILVDASGRVVDAFAGWNAANEARIKKLLE